MKKNAATTCHHIRNDDLDSALRLIRPPLETFLARTPQPPDYYTHLLLICPPRSPVHKMKQHVLEARIAQRLNIIFSPDA